MLRSPPAIVRRKLSEIVASRIKDYILEHELGEGDRLPTEQRMAEMFGVSRVSVREATKALGFLGIIHSAPRRGLTLGRVDMHRVTEYLGFHFAINNYPRQQLLHTRITIETGALLQVTQRMAQDRTIYPRLAAINDALRSARTADAFIAGDVAFHRMLLEASGIEPLVAFNGLLEVFFQRFRREVLEARRSWSTGIEGHQRILDALRAGRVGKAQDLLRQHLAHYRSKPSRHA
jgi:DNA-binding FadR family transcriptional regulator